MKDAELRYKRIHEASKYLEERILMNVSDLVQREEALKHLSSTLLLCHEAIAQERSTKK